MTQEALKLALGQLQAGFPGNAMQILREALAQTQEPVCPDCKAKVLYECVACSSNNYPPQRTEPEPVAWTCLIDSADFSENTITLAMQCEDYKVSAGTHWLSPTPPQRTWVGLTADEIWDEWLEQSKPERNTHNFVVAFTRAIEAKLKEKNT